MIYPGNHFESVIYNKNYEQINFPENAIYSF